MMASETLRDPLFVDDRTMRLAAAWLRRRGLGSTAPTPLLAARLLARWKLKAAVVAVCLLLVALGIAAVALLSDPGVILLVYSGGLVVGLVLFVAWLIGVRRADRRLGRFAPRRVAHAVPAGWRGVLGRRGLVGVAVIYGGSCCVIVLAAALGRTGQAPTGALALLAALLAFAAIAAAAVAYVVRRPALADDPVSLAADDVVRISDARGIATTPVPAVLAMVSTGLLEPAVAERLGNVAFAFLVVCVLVSVWATRVGRS
jgi:hypothetical protein